LGFTDSLDLYKRIKNIRIDKDGGLVIEKKFLESAFIVVRLGPSSFDLRRMITHLGIFGEDVIGIVHWVNLFVSTYSVCKIY